MSTLHKTEITSIKLNSWSHLRRRACFRYPRWNREALLLLAVTWDVGNELLVGGELNNFFFSKHFLPIFRHMSPNWHFGWTPFLNSSLWLMKLIWHCVPQETFCSWHAVFCYSMSCSCTVATIYIIHRYMFRDPTNTICFRRLNTLWHFPG